MLKIQNMLHECNDHLNVPSKPEDKASSAEPNGITANGDAPAGEATTPAEGGESSSTPAQPNGTQAQPNGTAEEASRIDEPVPDSHQAFAVLGLALIAMGEDIGSQMALRSLNHLVSHI